MKKQYILPAIYCCELDSQELLQQWSAKKDRTTSGNGITEADAKERTFGFDYYDESEPW